MTPSELNRYQGILTAKIAELERFTRHRADIVIERSADQLDDIQQASERALAVCNLDREFNQFQMARAALGRIQDGSFGTCQHCDEDIHPKRLAAVPWALFCIRCQEALDRHPEDGDMTGRELLSAA